MPRLVALISFLLFSSLVPAATSGKDGGGCSQWFSHFLNNNLLDELKYQETISFLEDRINFYRRMKENATPAITTIAERKIARLDTYLFAGHYSVVHRELRTMFRRVEGSVLLLEKLEQAIKGLRKMGDGPVDLTAHKQILESSGLPAAVAEELLGKIKTPEARRELLTAFEQQFQSYSVSLGNNYHYYTAIRSHLEDLLTENNCNKACKENITKLMQRLGTESTAERTRFPITFASSGRPDMKRIQEVMNNNPFAVMARLKKERNAELVDVFESFILQPPILSDMMQYLLQSSAIHKAKLIKLFKLIYDYRARELYFPKINQMVRSQVESEEKRLIAMKEVNTSVEYDEILITFSRRIDEQTRNYWKQTLAFAKDNDAEFYQRMLDAAEKGKRRGDISLAYDKSNSYKLAVVLASGGGAVWYYLKGGDKSDDPKDANVELGSEDDDNIENLADAAEDFLKKNKDKLPKPKSP